MSIMTENCPLCSIPTHETLLYEDDNIYMVSTKLAKGHKVRIMVATKRHTAIPSFEELTTAYAILIEHMTSLMLGQNWYIVDSKYATVPHHWHLMSCDTPMEDESDPLFEKTPKIRFPLKEKTVMIGIPARNEEKSLQAVLEAAKKYGDVVVVDDGSTDRTRLIAQQAKVNIIPHSFRFGYGNSIYELFKMAKEKGYDVLVTLDADGQHDPSEIPQFLKELKTSDIVIGNRFIGKSDTPNYRKLGIKAISKLSGIGDAQCGFRTYSKKAISTMADNMYERGMGVSVEILKIAQSNNLKISEVPCTIKYDEDSHSQNPLSHGLDVIRALFWAIIWEKPSKTLLPLGLFFLITTAIAGAQTINLYVQFHIIVLSWALLTVGSIICTILIFNILTFVLVFKNKKVSQ